MAEINLEQMSDEDLIAYAYAVMKMTASDKNGKVTAGKVLGSAPMMFNLLTEVCLRMKKNHRDPYFDEKVVEAIKDIKERNPQLKAL